MATFPFIVHCAPNPRFFFYRLKNSFVADHIDEKIIVVRFLLDFLRVFKVRKIRAILVHRRVLRRLGRVWSMTSTGEAISRVLETPSEQFVNKRSLLCHSLSTTE